MARKITQIVPKYVYHRCANNAVYPGETYCANRLCRRCLGVIVLNPAVMLCQQCIVDTTADPD